MADLNISKKTIYTLFSERGVKFLVPDYQRQYSWTRDECETLWEDFKAFTMPNNDTKNFDYDKDEYFLGTIVTFENDTSQNEIIDGQQRLVTLLLLLRAFYEAFGDSQNDIRNDIAKCIWTNKGRTPDKSCPKIKSEVASDDDVAELNNILANGVADKKSKSNYALNYRFFQKKISELKNDNPDSFADILDRILNNCVILPIEATTRNTAFRIFTTLNDRGMDLSYSDIFKAQFYKFYSQQGDKQSKENFVESWKELEEICNRIFHPRTGTPVDDLFRKYMYYLMAKAGIKSNTFPDLRDFYENYKDANHKGGNYGILQSEDTFQDLLTLLNFWNDIANRDDRFSTRALERLFVLSFAPNNIWSYVVSLYFMGNRNAKNNLDDSAFCKFLNKITAIILMHAIINPSVQNIRLPFVSELDSILKGKELKFFNFIQNAETVKYRFLNTRFTSYKMITRSMLAWWMFSDSEQNLLPLATVLETEHIYAKNRVNFNPLRDPDNLESLGNKSLIEKRINIRAADYRFSDKKRFYLGYSTGKKSKRSTEQNIEPTGVVELRRLAKEKIDFTEADIIERNSRILSRFIDYLSENGLLK